MIRPIGNSRQITVKSSGQLLPPITVARRVRISSSVTPYPDSMTFAIGVILQII